jgi:anti-sigma factor RsiW
MNSKDAAITENELHAYVDGRLPQERRAEVEAYLAENPQEHARIREYQEQNRLLHASYDAIMAEPIPTNWYLGVRRRPLLFPAVGAAVVCLILGGIAGWFLRGAIIQRSAKEVDFARQAALAHAVYTPEVRHPVEVTAEQEEHLVRWLSKRLGGTLKVPHLVDLGYELVGGRLLPGDQGPVAQFMYQEQSGRRLTLYVKTDPSSERETAFRFSQQGKVAVFYWLDRRLSYALSGEMRKDELLHIANAIYQRLNP